MPTPSRNRAREQHKISLRRDREDLIERVIDLIHWRRSEGFPESTDRQLAEYVAAIVDDLRAHNVRKFGESIKEVAERDGRPAKEVAVDMLYAAIAEANAEMREDSRIDGGHE